MCGLVGMAGSMDRRHVDMFQEMLVVNSLRGAHSTGVASISRGSNAIGLIKKVGSPFELFDSRRFDEVVGLGKKVLIGHGRLATVGEKTVSNAHPFAFDSVVGAHNGTLYPTSVRRMADSVGSFGTDSETIYAHIDKHGIDETAKQLDGAWALTYFDRATGKLSLLRNSERPLFFAYDEDQKLLFWASEVWMIRSIATRNRIKFSEDKIWELPTDTLYEFEVPEWGKTFEKPRARKMEGYKTPFSVSRTVPPTGGTTINRGGSQQAKLPFPKGLVLPGPIKPGMLAQMGPSSTVSKPSSSTSGSKKNVVKRAGPPDLTKADERSIEAEWFGAKPNVGKLIPFVNKKAAYQDYNDNMITQAEFDRRTRKGCDGCGANLCWGDAAKFLKHGVLCGQCMNDSDLVQLVNMM